MCLDCWTKIRAEENAKPASKLLIPHAMPLGASGL